MRQRDDGRYVLLLASGWVKVSRLEPDGREMLLALRGSGEALGEISAWDDSRRSATVEALGPCVAYVLSAAQFRRAVHELGAAEVFLRHVMNRLREGEDIRAELVGLSATQRVALVLARLASSMNADPAVPLTLDVGLTQEELARAVGLSRSAFAAELAKLRRRGLVSTSREQVVLHDLVGLRAAVADPPGPALKR